MDMTEADILTEVLGRYGMDRIIALALRFVLRNPYESFIIVDRDSKVRFMDRGSEKLFGIGQGEAGGLDVRRFVPESGLPLAISTGRPMIGRIFSANGAKRVGSVYPIIRNGETIGGLGRIIFHSLEELERVNAEVSKLKKEIHYFREKEQGEYRAKYTFDDLLGSTAPLRDAIDFARKISKVNTDVLILGESGTGKELLAHSIHAAANRNGPFVKVNCPAIPFDLAESELFGYAKGAFSGALSSGKPGKFEMANQGSVFLDEISSLPLSIQAKLLRVLQEREIERLGSTRTVKLTFKLIAATNVDLRTLVREGRFREDLYHRISRAIVHIPPLRERQADIPLYAAHFLEKVNRSFETAVRISPPVMDTFLAYPWPGNVRELIHVLEQAVLKAWNEGTVLPRHLASDLQSFRKEARSGAGPDRRPRGGRTGEAEAAERAQILSAITEAGGNRRKAAMLLGMPRSTFYLRLKRLKIDPGKAGKGE